jgi:ribosome biogenesis GTPase
MTQARVLAAHGTHLTIQCADGIIRKARPAGRKLDIVCGDSVTCRVDSQHDEWIVSGHDARTSLLARSDARGHSESIAANISMLVIVLAPVPEPDLFIVDRYLAAADSAPATAIIVRNKSDLPLSAATESELSAYQRTGYELLECSALTGIGLEPLRKLLTARNSLLAGQSGVGKSSLLRALVPESLARIGELMRETEGRHTTTTTMLYSLPQGGELLDSPGVRDFAPALEYLETRALGFIEIRQLASGCRFADCRHFEEPDCAVSTAAGSGDISARRYESYRRLRRMHDVYVRRRRTRSW